MIHRAARPIRFWKEVPFWIGAVCLGFLAAEILHDRFGQTDFGAYVMAASGFLEGRDLYFVTGGHARVPFLYPPPAAFCFVPFTLIGFEAAKLIWYLLNSVLIVAIWRLLRRQSGRIPGPLTLVFFLAIGFTLERELHVGNINLVTLALCLYAVSGREGRTALALAGAVMIKPQNGLLALPMVRSRFRAVAFATAILAGWALLPLPFYGAEGTRDLYASFWASSRAFAEASLHDFKFSSTTAGLWERGAALFGLDLSGHPLSLALGFLASVVVVFLACRRYRGGPACYYVAMAMIPLTVMSDYQVFLFAGPLAYRLLGTAWHGSWSPVRRLALAAALILYGGNWHDLWGDRLSDLFLEMGLQGIGTWGLVALALTGRDVRPPSPSLSPRIPRAAGASASSPG